MIQETTLEAFRAIQPMLATQEGRVLSLFVSAGAVGLTDEEAVDLYQKRHGSMKNPYAVRARRNGLVKQGLLQKTEARRVGKAGFKAIVWRAPQA